MSTKEEYKGVDLIKLFCAFLVVAIHTEPGSFNIWADRLIGIITRVAVPYFFVATGFFFCLNNKNNIIKYIKRIGILYIINTIVYLPFAKNEISFILFNNSGFIKTLCNIVKLFFNGIAPHLWYLPACMVSIGLYWILAKRINKKCIVMISLFFFIFGTLFSTYLNVFSNTGIYIINVINSLIRIIGFKNGLFYGFFFVSLGAYIEEFRPNRSFKVYFILLMISLCLLAIESYFVIVVLSTKSTILWFSQILCVYALFNFSLCLDVGDYHSTNIRKLSTLIYNFHYIFIYILNIFGYNSGFTVFIVVLLCTILLSLLIIILSKKYKILKVLY